MGKIALLLTSYGIGGIERFASWLSDLLNELGHELFLFTLIDLPAAYQFNGPNICIGSSWWSSIYRLWRAKRKYKIDCTISMDEYLSTMNVLTGYSKSVAMIHNHKLYVELHNVIKARLINYLFNKYSRSYEAIICVSHGIENKVRESFKGANILTIVNSVDIDSIVSQSEAYVDTELFNDETFVHVGRICEQKNQKRMLLAFSILCKKHSNARLIIIGDGNDKDKLIEVCRELGIEGNTKFLGFISNPYPYMRASKALVLSSDYEGFGYVLVEAFACGIPVISTDCYAGPREIIAPGTEGQLSEGIERTEYGILSALDEQSLALAMSEMLENTDYYQNYKAKVLKRAEDYSFAVSQKLWSDFIEEVLK